VPIRQSSNIAPQTAKLQKPTGFSQRLVPSTLFVPVLQLESKYFTNWQLAHTLFNYQRKFMRIAETKQNTQHSIALKADFGRNS